MIEICRFAVTLSPSEAGTSGVQLLSLLGPVYRSDRAYIRIGSAVHMNVHLVWEFPVNHPSTPDMGLI